MCDISQQRAVYARTTLGRLDVQPRHSFYGLCFEMGVLSMGYIDRRQILRYALDLRQSLVCHDHLPAAYRSSPTALPLRAMEFSTWRRCDHGPRVSRVHRSFFPSRCRAFPHHTSFFPQDAILSVILHSFFDINSCTTQIMVGRQRSTCRDYSGNTTIARANRSSRHFGIITTIVSLSRTKVSRVYSQYLTAKLIKSLYSRGYRVLQEQAGAQSVSGWRLNLLCTNQCRRICSTSLLIVLVPSGI